MSTTEFETLRHSLAERKNAIETARHKLEHEIESRPDDWERRAERRLRLKFGPEVSHKKKARHRKNPFLVGTEARLLQLKAEQKVIDGILEHEDVLKEIGIDAFLTSFKQADHKITSPQKREAFRIFVDEAVDRLLVHYAQKESLGEKTAEWFEEKIRAELALELALQEAGLRALKKTKLREEVEQREYDRTRAARDVLMRILYSNHLSCCEKFLRAAASFRLEAAAPKDAYAPADYVRAWQAEVDRLVVDFSKRYRAL